MKNKEENPLMTTKTYRELNILLSSINNVINNEETKVQKKLHKFYDKIKTYNESYSSQLDELRLDNAAVDDKGILLLDDKGGYKFDKEGLKKLTKDFKSLDEKEFDYKLIEVINPQGLEKLHFLNTWTVGIVFDEIETEEEL
jgi:hypothetical protein